MPIATHQKPRTKNHEIYLSFLLASNVPIYKEAWTQNCWIERYK